ncbi:MAG: N-acetylmuramoyl-L-alanine amidase-like domain-containing protein [Fimbriimonadaceae bacterium]
MIALLANFVLSIDDTQFVGREKFKTVMSQAASLKNKPLGEVVGGIGLSFVDTPYVGWTLERNEDREFCFVTLEGLDCVTFFETSLALARMIKSGQERPSELVDQVTKTRYRNGAVSGYPSRLHYTSDWIYDNDRRGNVRNVSSNLKGAIPLGKVFSFMTDHSDTYRQLRAHPELLDVIKRDEARLTKTPFSYVPTSDVEAIESKLMTGDIIGVVTKTKGMDCSHTGLIIREGKRARFLHASSVARRVMLDGPISEYLKRNDRNLGIMVGRPR